MGLFNWAMKGIRVDTRIPKTASEEAVVALEQAPNVPQPFEPEATSVQASLNDWLEKGTHAQPSASSILFERSEPSNPFDARNQFAGAFGGHTLGNRNILVITPDTNESVRGIVENLQRGEACIICLENIPLQDAQRRLDFLGGVIYALNGSIKPLNANTYILTPNGLGVKL